MVALAEGYHTIQDVYDLPEETEFDPAEEYDPEYLPDEED